ncbi:hypothetical protein [Planococcus shixiaomingii]|uniref:hypothetical protein n=1 Tax=Planococcus shixiaomingii TaxID=3058393 RepID=UPI00260B1FF8|nr:hypothetical protein [Planococcus sp. N022]WKA56645.1 hypothetical protein QWY21_09950 [Planococcus sp. N022]
MRKKLFSFLSAAFFLLMIVPLALPYSAEGFDLFVFFLSLNFYLPLVFGVFGIISGLLGMEGSLKFYLVLLNALSFVFYLFVIIMAIFGFREP